MPVTLRASHTCPSVLGIFNTAELQTARHAPSLGGCGDDTPLLDGEREPLFCVAGPDSYQFVWAALEQVI